MNQLIIFMKIYSKLFVRFFEKMNCVCMFHVKIHFDEMGYMYRKYTTTYIALHILPLSSLNFLSQDTYRLLLFKPTYIQQSLHI